jgi:hypothetical protein
MNYEYNASGGLSINKTTHCNATVEYLVICPTVFINMTAFVPTNKVVHTGKYSMLLNGSIATCGFNDNISEFYALEDRAVLYPFSFGEVT